MVAFVEHEPNDRERMSSTYRQPARTRSILTAAIVVCLSQQLMAQTAPVDRSDSAHGAAVAQVFFSAGASAEWGQHTDYGYAFSRAHFGYRYILNSRWRAEVILDAGEPTRLAPGAGGREGSEHSMKLKFANIEWKPSARVAIQAGSILQNHYITQERFWGLRFQEKTFQDRYYGLPSADLGVIGYFSPSTAITLDAAITNGNGFRRVQDEASTLRFAGGATWSPGEAVFRAYYAGDEQAAANTRFTTHYISGFAGFPLFSWIRAGIDVNYASNFGATSASAYGGSVFALVNAGQNGECFARWDVVQTSGDAGPLDYLQGDAILAGYALRLNTLLRAGLHYRLWLPRDAAEPESHTCLLSIEMKY